jgi:hypothetical protein
LLAVLVGSFMLTYSLTLAAAIEILKAHVSTADAVVAFIVFAFASITTISAPIVLALVAPERSAERLAAWRRWLLGNSRAIGLVALMVVGALLIGGASTIWSPEKRYRGSVAGFAALEHCRRDSETEASRHQNHVPHLIDDSAAREILRHRLDHLVGGLEEVLPGFGDVAGHVARDWHRGCGDLDRDRGR